MAAALPFVAEPGPEYRRNVGLMLLNHQGRVWVGRRTDTDLDAWQMPQGGIDKGEAPAEAALRELEEEIGTAKAEILFQSDGWVTYDLPPELRAKVWGGKWRGQAQRWFALRFTGTDADINIATKHPEFGAWRWAGAAGFAVFVIIAGRLTATSLQARRP